MIRQFQMRQEKRVQYQERSCIERDHNAMVDGRQHAPFRGRCWSVTFFLSDASASIDFHLSNYDFDTGSKPITPSKLIDGSNSDIQSSIDYNCSLRDEGVRWPRILPTLSLDRKDGVLRQTFASQCLQHLLEVCRTHATNKKCQDASISPVSAVYLFIIDHAPLPEPSQLGWLHFSDFVALPNNWKASYHGSRSWTENEDLTGSRIGPLLLCYLLPGTPPWRQKGQVHFVIPIYGSRKVPVI